MLLWFGRRNAFLKDKINATHGLRFHGSWAGKFHNIEMRSLISVAQFCVAAMFVASCLNLAEAYELRLFCPSRVDLVAPIDLEFRGSNLPPSHGQARAEHS